MPREGLAEPRLRDRRTPRNDSEREGADGPICARSVPEKGTGTGDELFIRSYVVEFIFTSGKLQMRSDVVHDLFEYFIGKF